jgi:amino acid adenylation domain-containing protein
MKILITMQLPYVPALGGANKCNRMVAEALFKKSHDVQVIVPATNEANAGTLNHFRSQLAAQAIQVHSKAGIDLFHLNGVEVHALHEQAQVRSHLIRQIKTFEPDWVLVSGEEWSQGLLGAALKALPSRVVYLAHTVLFLPFGPVAFFPSPQRAHLLEQVAGILTCGRFVKEYIQEWSGIESSVFHFPAYGSGPFPNLGCFDKGFVTLINPSAGKGISIFLELAREFPDVQFGCVPTWGTTQNDQVKLKRFPNIICLEPSEDIDQIFAQTRVIVLPSLWPEGFPLTSVEAMLRGIPVLASNAGGLPEAKLGTDFVLPVKPIERFTEELDDRLIPIPSIPEQTEDDIKQWCHALESLLSERTFYERQSSIARRTAQDFVSNLGVGPLEDFLNNLASQPKKTNSPSKLHMKSQDLSSVEVGTNDLSNRLADLTPEQQALLSQWLQTPSSAQQDEKGQSSLSSLDRDSDVSSSASSLFQTCKFSDQLVSKNTKSSELNERSPRMESFTNEPPLVSSPRNKPLPLSFAQQRLWFLHQLEPNSTAYLISSAFHLRGRLLLKPLEASLQTLVQRHEALRTTFPLVNEEPVQQVAPTWPFHLPVIDLQSLLAEGRNQEIERLIDKDAQQPFELAVGPLFRFRVLKLGAEEHILLMTFHHIISDGWSMGIFYRELGTAYTAFCAGQPPSLTDLAIQYADYAVWQRAWLQGEQLDRQLAYWREQLEGVSNLMLPTDFPRPAIQAYRGARVTLAITPAITDGLKAVSLEGGATLFMTLLAAFQVVLQRWSGQDDVCVGIPSAGRIRSEIEPVMGFFINTLVIRTDMSGQPTFFDLLAQVRDRCLGADAHQDVPFEKLVEVLKPTRDLSRTPFFQVFVNMMPGGTDPFTLPGLTVTPMPKTSLDSKFDLTLYLHETSQQLRGTVVYNATLFKTERIEALVAQYHKVLEQLVAAPERSLPSYSLVTDESRIWLPNPHARLEAPPQDSVLTCIRRWAARTPDQVAVRQGTETLCYGELLNRSEACSCALIKQGEGPGEVVAIRGPRSIGLLVALLGVWRAGGVVLLLDPLLPGPRQRVMQQTSGAKFLLEIGSAEEPDQGGDERRVPRIFVVPSTGVVDSSGCVGDEPESSLPPEPVEGPAYVFFTSGTTGVPKGVLGSHQALAHFLAWERETLAIEPEDRVAQFTGLSFDVVLRDLFLPLTSGATVCLPPEEAGGHEQLAWAAAEQITVMHLVPSVASFWLAAITEPIALPSLRWVVFAGEPLTAQLLERWEAACPGQAQFVNLYGPTETTLAKCWYLIPPDDREEGVQPIGRPLPQSQLLVMGEGHRLCGLGEVGELVIRTPFCSLGYLNAEEEIQSRFVPNPYRNDPTDWLYHTGDLGRYRLDGTVEILGRRDDQVKIRGVRIEPQEVTAMLDTCPEVQTCTVLAGRDKEDEIALTAFVVLQLDASLSGSAMRTYLSARMPSVLVPSQYVLLEQFPLTPNGKIDRQALRSLTPTEGLEEKFVAPRTPLEEAVAGIFQEVLGLKQVGVHDNFFDLGGHSLLATQALARIRKTFEGKLTLRDFFAIPTVAVLAEWIATLQGNITRASRTGKTPSGNRQRGRL